MRHFALLLIVVLAATPASAATSDWQELAPGVRLRMITSDQRDADNKTLLGLELEMPANHKTYWSVPGETGIPTTIDFAGSDGVGSYQMLWPYPSIENEGGFVDYVYRGNTVLPFELDVTGETAQLRASIVMGICSDICVPAQASFEMPLRFDKPDHAEGLRLTQAVALAPIAWDGEGEGIGDVSLDASGEYLVAEVLSPEIDPASIIASSPDNGPLFGAPQKSPDGALVRWPVLGGTEISSAAGASVSLTFETSRGPFEIARQIVASGSTSANW